MNIRHSKGLMAVSSMAVLLALGACGERAGERTVDRKVDSGIAKSDRVANEAGTDAKTAVMGAAADSKAAVSNAGDTLGAKIDDAQITAKVNAGLAADKDLSAIKIDVDTKQGVVTLMGPVPSSAAKARASDIAKNVKDVKSVNNQLTVKTG